MTAGLFIAIGILVWIIVSCAYAVTQVGKIFEPNPTKTPWYEFLMYPPLVLVILVMMLIEKIRNKK